MKEKASLLWTAEGLEMNHHTPTVQCSLGSCYADVVLTETVLEKEAGVKRAASPIYTVGFFGGRTCGIELYSAVTLLKYFSVQCWKCPLFR